MTRRFIAAVIWHDWRRVLRCDIAEIVRAVVEIAAAAVTPPTAMPETILAAALIVTILSIGWDIRLRLATAGYESRQATDIRRCVIAALNRLHIRLLLGLMLRLMLRPVLLLISWWKRLRVARQIGLPLLHVLRRLLCDLRLRRKARLVLAGEGLIVVVVEIIVSRALRGCLLALRVGLIVVVGILLAELFLRRRDQAEIMFGVLVIIFSRYRIAGAL